MATLDCETRKRCHACHHMTANGCALLAALETAVGDATPRPTGLVGLAAWTGRTAEAAES